MRRPIPSATKLQKQLADSLEQQAATSEILKVISRPNFDLQIVFDTLVETATRLCHASASNIWRPIGATYHHVASYGVPPKFKKVLDGLALRPDGKSVVGRCLQARKTIYVPDLSSDSNYAVRDAKDFGGYRGLLCVPFMHEDTPIGVLMVAHRTTNNFTDQQIALVENFAAQAVIAIENARLLNDLRESLQQQTATADVLRVISSSPGELPPVFDTMLAKATELCGANYGALWLRTGDGFRYAAVHGDLPKMYFDYLRDGTLIRVKPEVPLAQVVQTRQPVQVADMRLDPSYLSGDPLPVSGVEVAGIRYLPQALL